VHATTYGLDKNLTKYELKHESIILDMHFLSQCEYLVCTFSSNVCRMVYELMQTRFDDASWRAVSLDDHFYVNGMDRNKAVAIADHQPGRDEELELLKGDVLNYLTYWEGNRNGFLNGFLFVHSERLNKKGLVPFYKIKKII
jgi:glycoprotein 6-alpha-L-fucosyltransferase